MFSVFHEKLFWLRNLLTSLACCLCSLAVQGAEPEQASSSFSAEQLEFFEKEIRPLLATHCYECHGPETQEASLRLDSRELLLKGGDTGPAIKPGHPEMSELIDAINYEADSYQMPPDGKLSADEIAALTRWVQDGAAWPEEKIDANTDASGFNLEERAKHWSFQPVKPIAPPAISDTGWPLQPIDHFILAKLEAANLQPAPPADREVWLRRVTFDLTGLPPTPEERETFLNDDSDSAYEKVVDRLLASEQYGVRWARHWLDLTRFAETYGHEFDYNILHAWRYRDYVVRAFNQDLPYDQFVKEHIAGDLLESPRRSPEGNNESVQGTAFYWFAQGKHSPVDIRAEECDLVDNQIDVLSKTFLGLTVSCTRCHDHKFDPITTADYYALAGYLQSSRSDWTIINDTPQAQKALQRLHELSTTEHQELSQKILTQLSKEIQSGGLLPKLKDKLFAEPRIKTEQHPFFLWYRLSKMSGSAQKKQPLDRAEKALREEAEFRKNAQIYTRFQPEKTTDWFVNSFSMPLKFSGQGELVLSSLENNEWEFTTGAAQHTSQLGNQLQGSFRSPTFEVTNKFIHYRVRKRGGLPSQQRGYKQGALNLVVDGLQLIRDPLYGSFSQSVPNNDVTLWITQATEKAIGHKAYIEIMDEDDGDLVVKEILFSDNPKPPFTLINPTIYQEYANSSLRSIDAPCYDLIRRISNRAAQNLEDLSPEEIDILNAILPAALSLMDKEVKKSVTEFRNEITGLLKLIPPPEKIIAITDGTPENEHVLIRGNHEKPGTEVPRRFLEVFNSEVATEELGSNRLNLAEQIASAENPFTARVIVNRLWLHHFGRGIVPTPDNFGILGEPASHQELLDYLATELVKQNWSLKALHRQMVLSQTYRMSSEPADVVAEKEDPANRLWHRMPIRRLEAEAVRDAVLLVSGQIDPKLGGESIPPFLTRFMEGRGRPAKSGPLDGDRRRSLYLMVRRNFLNPMFLAFDFPTPMSTMGRRSTSNVPAQALTMMNNPFVIEQAQHWTSTILKSESPGETDSARIRKMYLQAFCREPEPHEIELGLTFLEQQRQEYQGDPDVDNKCWADYAHVLFNVKDFIYLN
ncbi:MAG: PSD1 domain-containing protein [Planctomycetaceae bacterium]|nr:PSD1 domain-containing protein [Planctomycetaceae bacterium]